MRYLLLLHLEEAATDNTPTDWEPWERLHAWLEEEGIVVLRSGPLKEAPTAHTVRVRNGETLVTDGPFAETKEVLGGYYLIDVPSHERAVEVARHIPVATYGRVDVRPVNERLAATLPDPV